MQFREPSTLDRLFKAPPNSRPSLDLGVTAAPYILPSYLRGADVGATCWANLVIGFAWDEAYSRGVRLRLLADALEAGDLVAQAFFFPAEVVGSRPNDLSRIAPHKALAIGSVAANRTRLTVSGGPPDNPILMGYEHRGVGYIATHGILDDNVVEIPPLYSCDRVAAAGEVPAEMQAAKGLKDLADAMTRGLDNGDVVVRADFSLITADRRQSN